MIKEFLLKARKAVADFLLGESPGDKSHQQNITVTGSNNNITIINGNKSNSNLILPETENKVKHFTSKNVECRINKHMRIIG